MLPCYPGGFWAFPAPPRPVKKNFPVHPWISPGPGKSHRKGFPLKGFVVEHKTCDILAAERLRLMRFDNRLIIDYFQKAICILKWQFSLNNKFKTGKYEPISTQIHFQKC